MDDSNSSIELPEKSLKSQPQEADANRSTSLPASRNYATRSSSARHYIHFMDVDASQLGAFYFYFLGRLPPPASGIYQ